MKPKMQKNKDQIFSILNDGWESLPQDLENSLYQIPIQHQQKSAKITEKIILLLNTILLVWGLGIIYQFSSQIIFISNMVSDFFMRLGGYSNVLIDQPLFIFLILGMLGLAWLNSELKTHR